MAAVNAHFTNLDLFLSAGKLDEARQERLNLQRNIFYALSGININSYVFACLVAELDGQPVTDFTEPGLTRTIKTLESWGVTYGTVTDTLDEVKKKINNELTLHFPKWFNEAETFNFYERLKARALLLAEMILGTKPNAANLLKQIDDYFLTLQKPANFDSEDPANVVTQHEAAYAAMLVGLSQNNVTDAGRLPVFQLYKYLEYFDKKAEKGLQT